MGRAVPVSQVGQQKSKAAAQQKPLVRDKFHRNGDRPRVLVLVGARDIRVEQIVGADGDMDVVGQRIVKGKVKVPVFVVEVGTEHPQEFGVIQLGEAGGIPVSRAG